LRLQYLTRALVLSGHLREVWRGSGIKNQSSPDSDPSTRCDMFTRTFTQKDITVFHNNSNVWSLYFGWADRRGWRDMTGERDIVRGQPLGYLFPLSSLPPMGYFLLFPCFLVYSILCPFPFLLLQSLFYAVCCCGPALAI